MRQEIVIAAAALGLAAPLASAGLIWQEVGDAGSLIGSAQTVTGGGPLAEIRGATSSADRQDLYLIEIKDVQNFSAIVTDLAEPGFDDYDTQLWLFDTNGFLVTGNDDDAASNVQFGSALFPGPNGDGTPGLVAPGLYVLAVTGFGNPGNGGPGDPLDVNGVRLANQLTFTEHTGPDGPGGANPLAGWVGGSLTGDYRIVMTGTSALPGPGALALLGLAGLVARRGRSR
jgi:hypothetical protein